MSVLVWMVLAYATLFSGMIVHLFFDWKSLLPGRSETDEDDNDADGDDEDDDDTDGDDEDDDDADGDDEDGP